MAGEYISEKHRQLVAAYRQAEREHPKATVWPERQDAINRVVVFDSRPRD